MAGVAVTHIPQDAALFKICKKMQQIYYMSCKNGFYKNKQRCRDGAVCLSNTLGPHGKTSWWKTSGTRRGTIPCNVLPMKVNIFWLQDTLATLSPSLHLATAVVTYVSMHIRILGKH